jgi:hypothetical protein
MPRDQPLSLSSQAAARTTHPPLIRIGMRRLNRSPILQAQRVSMEVVRWKRKFRPTGRKFFLSCRQPPWNNDRPLAPPPLSRSQPRQAALWKRKSLFRRSTRDRILLPLWKRTLPQIPPLLMIFPCYHGRGPWNKRG